MAIRVIDIGTASGTAGATVTITGVTIPAGALIFIAAFEKNTNGSFGNFTDTASNSYFGADVSTTSAGTSGGTFVSQYAFNASAINNGNITYTKATSGVFTALTAFYATGILRTSDPLDSNAANGTTGTSTTPSITSVSPLSVSGELVVGFLAWVAGAGDTYIQDTANGYITPFDSLINTGAAAGIGGGYIIRPITVAPTFAPTLNNSRAWAISIQGFKPGSDPPGIPDDVDLYATVA
jgi:hypothetical protein